MWYLNRFAHHSPSSSDSIPVQRLWSTWKTSDWKYIKLLVFDAPTKLSEPYEQRIKLLENSIIFVLLNLSFCYAKVLLQK